MKNRKVKLQSWQSAKGSSEIKARRPRRTIRNQTASSEKVAIRECAASPKKQEGPTTISLREFIDIFLRDVYRDSVKAFTAQESVLEIDHGASISSAKVTITTATAVKAIADATSAIYHMIQATEGLYPNCTTDPCIRFMKECSRITCYLADFASSNAAEANKRVVEAFRREASQNPAR